MGFCYVTALKHTPLLIVAKKKKGYYFQFNNRLSIEVFAGEDSVSLRYASEPAVRLSLVPSGSGEAYKAQKGIYGQPTQWHRRGDSGCLMFKDLTAIK